MSSLVGASCLGGFAVDIDSYRLEGIGPGWRPEQELVGGCYRVTNEKHDVENYTVTTERWPVAR